MTTTSIETKAVAKSLKWLKEWQGERKIAVGLSGGVDSSIAASLLVQAGWDVQGLTLWLMSGKGSCCSEGLVDAAGICKQLKIPHNVVDSRHDFQEEVVSKIIEGYKSGITPLPCSKCNKNVKFPKMLKWAKKELQFNFIATGHYARVHSSKLPKYTKEIPGEHEGRNLLLRGIDRTKDQSYFLYDLPQEILGNIIFPLGELTKEEIRKEALRKGLRTASKPESQDLCLVEKFGSMKAFLNEYIPSNQGEIVLKDGTVVGSHNGIQHFTIGQRKGLGIAWKEPLHVIKIDAEKNQILVAPRSGSSQKCCIVEAINWLSIKPPKSAIEIEVQVRYRSNPTRALLTPIKVKSEEMENEMPSRCSLIFDNEQFSITPGQAAVFYSDEVVLGGGVIAAN